MTNYGGSLQIDPNSDHRTMKQTIGIYRGCDQSRVDIVFHR